MIRRCAVLAFLGVAILGCGTVRTPTEPAASAGSHSTMINAANFSFTPANLTIKAGSSVTWSNTGGFHNVTADDGSFRCSNGCDDTGGNGNPSSVLWSFSRTFPTPGVIHFHCQVHGAAGGVGMSGTLTVSAP
jgi:plastocyanin